MGPRERHLDWLRSYTGVRHLAEMTPEVTEAVRLSEESVRTQVGIEYVNEGYSEALERDVRVCLFCDTTFPVPETRLFLKCDDGTIMGRTLCPGEMEDYRLRDDVIWISEDFVVFPHVVGTGEERFVLAASPFRDFNDAGAINPIVTIPAGPSDAILKGRYGVPDSREIATVIVAYDLS
ncbi:MAG: hypothetical protein GX224_02555 [Thermoplasmatales archaeon]|nr:hypothetical protein [Thermoplasmatales archaeon]